MSRTHRRHEAPSKAKKRGPKNRGSDEPQPILKTNKQRRKGDRQALRREWA